MVTQNRKIEHRNIFLIYLFSFITFGIYSLYWFVSTKEDINSLGGSIPTAWLLLVPLVNFYWIYKYSEYFSVKVKKDNSPMLWFLLSLFVGIIIPAIVQSELNNLA